MLGFLIGPAPEIDQGENCVEYTSNDGSRYRNERARKATSIAVEICGLTLEQAEMLISKVMDYKGNLEVTWKIHPSKHQRDAFSRAWGLVGEMQDAVEHVVED